MNAGGIAQVGTPAELYHTPKTSFVATSSVKRIC